MAPHKTSGCKLWLRCLPGRSCAKAGVPMCRTVGSPALAGVRYYGYYSIVCRGKREKQNKDDVIPCILDAIGLSKEYRKNWVRLIQKIYPVKSLKGAAKLHLNHQTISPLQYSAVEFYLTHNCRFSIIRSSKSVFLSTTDPTRAPLYRVVTEFDYLGNKDIMPPLAAGRSPLTENQKNGIK